MVIKRIGTVIGLLILLAGIVLVTEARPLAALSADYDPRTDIDSFRKLLQKDLARFGGADTYAALKKIFPGDNGRPHVAGHVFGEELYAAEGATGVAVCDSSLGFGCFHGLFVQAISNEGSGIVRELDTVCVERYGVERPGCQHGIGHGILEYTGHDDLSRALVLCKETTQPNPLLGCTSGVFMEYFFPSRIDRGGMSTLREPDASDMFLPCRSIPPEFMNSCFFELGQWLPHVVEFFPRDCERLSGDERRHCFFGVGAYLGNRQYPIEDKRNRCALFSDEDELLCRAGAAWALSVVEDFEGMSGLCDDASAEREVRCLSLADISKQGGL